MVVRSKKLICGCSLNSVQSKMLLCGCSEQDAMMWLFRARCYDEVFQSKRLGCGCSKKEAGFWLFRRDSRPLVALGLERVLVWGELEGVLVHVVVADVNLCVRHVVRVHRVLVDTEADQAILWQKLGIFGCPDTHRRCRPGGARDLSRARRSAGQTYSL